MSSSGSSSNGGSSGTSSSGSGSSGSGSSGSGSSSSTSSGGVPSGGGSSGGSSGGDAGGGSGGLNPGLPPGGNFDLSHWMLEEPTGATISPAKLEGPSGFQDTYFFTNAIDGSMSFWDPENGSTTPNSNYPRSELRELSAQGTDANWAVAGSHTLSATLKVTQVPDHVCVGQIHVGTGTPSTTKPLLELFYYANGDIVMAIEDSPSGNQTPHQVGKVPLGTPWSYVIGLTGNASGNTVSLVLGGGSPQTWAMPSGFDQENMYFKAGDYDQSAGSSGTVGAKVQFYALGVVHGP
jgi:Alginate lyase